MVEMRTQPAYRKGRSGNPPPNVLRAGKVVQLYGGGLKVMWESDRLIVLGDGRADHKPVNRYMNTGMGKGATEPCSLQRKHDADRKDCYIQANLPAGNSKQGSN